MLQLHSEILKFNQKGEKSGWTYLEISAEIAHQLKPNTKKSFRIKGLIDAVPINGIALLPMGEGNFIFPLNKTLRQKLKKEHGEMVLLQIEEDKAFTISMPEELEICLLEEPPLMHRFMQQPASHQRYFYKWINDAKTFETKAKRIAMTVNAMQHCWDFGQMLRNEKAKSLE